MYRRLLHVLYTTEFLVALMAVFAVWREVGGQGHLDYMAWYWKIAIGVPAAYAIVRFTVAMGVEKPARVRQLLAWGLTLLALVVGAGLITYYYHVNEPLDDTDEEPGTITPAAFLGGGYGHDDEGVSGGRLGAAVCRSGILPALPCGGIHRADSLRTCAGPGTLQDSATG